MNNISKTTRSDRNRQMIAGVKKHFANTPSIVVDGTSYTPADIEGVLQTSIDSSDATTAATAVFHKAVAAEKAAHAKGDSVYRGLRVLLSHQYMAMPDTLADFGVLLPQRQTPNAEAVAGAVAKRAATRVARHTMGKRQKSGIKGQVPATSPTTAPSPTPTTPAKA
jgi:hypothetical protein